MNDELLTMSEMAHFLRTSTGYIRNQIYLEKEGDTIPRSFKLGKRRMWSKKDVEQWLDNKRNQ